MTYSEKLNILVKNTIESYKTSEELTTYKKYYDNSEYYNNLYRGKIDLFFTENNINIKLFCEGMNKVNIIPMLEKLQDHTQNIIANFEKYWLESFRIEKRFENIYGGANPILGTDIIDNIRIWLFNNSYKNEMLTLEQQNTLMKNYIHFDASMKRIKSVS